MALENWLPIPSLPGYDVSDHGRVRSWVYRGPVPRLRSTAIDRHGYPGFVVRRGVGSARLTVHVLVAEAFHGPRPAGMVVRHLDGNPCNNHASNLCYGTASENERDKLIHGTDHNASKSHCPKGHPYDLANTYIRTTRAGHVQRNCRACNRKAVETLRAGRAS